ncbi:ATP-binding protein [Kitasatospora sp. NPDC006697]|uniref:ATP-binding protein n=1 Tax=Kitasatospora sp. NPDC006697 TaxID=3364020 RepID=UPI00368DB43F
MSETLENPQVVVDEFTRWLPRHGKSVGGARALLRDFLAAPGDAGPCLTTAELVVSELVTNAVLYGCPDGGQFGDLIFVRFERRRGLVLIEVHDANGDRPAACRAGAEDEHGRGLWLVEQLAQEWGCGPREGIGKRVWAVIGG